MGSLDLGPVNSFEKKQDGRSIRWICLGSLQCKSYCTSLWLIVIYGEHRDLSISVDVGRTNRLIILVKCEIENAAVRMGLIRTIITLPVRCSCGSLGDLCQFALIIT
jgi:hypothetical protein